MSIFTQLKNRGARLITISAYGNKLIYHFNVKGKLENVEVPAGEARSVAKIFPNAWIYEKELVERWSVKLKIEKRQNGRGVEIPFGPYHPALEEPEYFQIFLEGERIVDVDFELGYNYREIEKKVTTFTWPKAIILMGRICGICSSAHTQAFAYAVERINGIDVPRRARFLRTLGAELERIHSHLLWLGLIGENAGFETLFMLAWGAREHALNMLERFAGKRVHYNYMAYGGVSRDVSDEDVNFMKRELKELSRKYREVEEVALGSELLEDRLKGVGKLTKEQAIEYGVVGPTARASGIEEDTRRSSPYSAYEEVDFEIPTEHTGDAYARMLVRMREVWESIHILEQVMDKLPGGKVQSVKTVMVSKQGKAGSVVEAPRGENFHYVVAGKQAPKFSRVRPPTFTNLAAMPVMLRNHWLSDVPVVIYSIDPCFACTDRVLVVDLDKGEVRRVEFD